MKPRCAAKAAAPVRAGTWWSTPPVWPAFPSPRAASNRRAAPSMTGRVRTTVDPVARRAATAAVDAVTGAGVVTAADRADRAVRERLLAIESVVLGAGPEPLQLADTIVAIATPPGRAGLG